MSGDPEAAADVLTGGIIAATVEGAAAQGARDDGTREKCLNCGAAITGAYCSACGQPAHVHRSLIAIWHDILHGVFHFEGKLWKTLPELFFRPGRLTRRYIDGERVKFISPMALFLFTVFLMFAVFSMTGVWDGAATLDSDDVPITSQFQEGNRAAMEASLEEIAELREQREDEALTEAEKAKIDERIAGLESSVAVMDALAKGDFARIAKIQEEEKARQENQKQRAEQSESTSTSWPPPGSRLHRGIEQAQENPKLLFYKLKTNAYKFSWALIPMSVPFLWMLFFWRRDIHLYDHAIFTTYSISFMMLFLIVLSLLSAVGVSAAIWGTALVFIPPLHLYKQLRGTYGLSRIGAMFRLFFLLIASFIVLLTFLILLTLIGALE